MKIGPYDVSLEILSRFRLDGGSMFGSVPKALWSRIFESDQDNCIPLVARSMVLRAGEQTILVDVGCGEKWSDKAKKIFAIDNTETTELSFKPEEVTDVILTHLHFDHAGGISYYDGEKLKLSYPNARVFLQRANLENAKNPSPKEKASYLKENFEILETTELILIEGNKEILPGIKAHQVNGHTEGQQMIEVVGEGKSVFFPTDLIPTSRHLPIPFHMGYDNCAATVMKEKQALLPGVVERGDILVFEHDPDTAAATIKVDEKGRYSVDQIIDFS